jgi:hypothetical protein
MDRSEVARSVGLGVVVFVATLLVLGGLAAIAGRSGNGSGATVDVPASSAPPTATVVSPSASATTSPSGSASAVPSPTPPSASSDDPILAGAGDIAVCGQDGDEATAALLEGIAGTVFTAGDNTYPAGTERTYRECFGASWGRMLERIRPAPGNHDWQTDTLDAYRAYFGTAAVNDAGDSWYAYELGTWQVIVLDSECDRVDGCAADSRQGRWLAETLAESAARCTLAIWHRPRFSSGYHGNDADVQPFWDALYGAGADVIVNGHDHDYERFAPMAPDGREDRDRGLRQFVVGTGGAELRDFATVQPNSELRLAVSHGILAFTLRAGAYDWRWIPTDGEVADRGTTSCH